MIKLHFDKLYKKDRIDEPCFVSVPFSKGTLKDISHITVLNDKQETILSQATATTLWEDGSVKYAFIRFLATIPGNKACDYFVDYSNSQTVSADDIASESNDCIFIDTGNIKVQINKNSSQLFDLITFNKRNMTSRDLAGPTLTDKYGRTYLNNFTNVEIIENGPIACVIKADGTHAFNGESIYTFSVTITAFKGQSKLDVSYRVINTSTQPLQIQTLKFNYKPLASDFETNTMIGISAYDTKFQKGTDNEKLELEITADSIKYTNCEHFPETFYGTFFADYTDEISGLCATIYQAKQNFPKSFTVDRNGLAILLVPPSPSKVLLQPGMARSQRIQFNFHTPNVDAEELDHISTMYQMPDIPRLEPAIYEEAGVFENIFTNPFDFNTETYLTNCADSHGHALGMMNWGDFPDMNYTNQGRGNGELVWCNNEYDFPHAAMLLYAKTGLRRFMDYALVSAIHQMEVDVCHYNSNPLLFEGQWMHSAGHCLNSNVECSHQWVEGLLDYYHLTNDKFALDTALGIGNNLLRLLETDKFSAPGQTSARETGWALRSLTALYQETQDPKWLEKCDWIVSHFTSWKEEYGLWLQPYTNDTAIRVPFMISVAVGSLIRYHRVRPSKTIKALVIEAVDDLIENCRLANGLFFYKELPSLQKNGNNPLVLEALAIAYELTGDKKYIEAGMITFKYITSNVTPAKTSPKEIVGDSVLLGGNSPKAFAQCMLPIAEFYNCAKQCELL